MSSSAVRFSSSSLKGKDPVTKQRIQFHIDSIAGLPTDIPSSSALIAITVDGNSAQHETGAVKSSSASSRAWHENIGPIPLRETAEITFSLRAKSKTILGKRNGKLIAKSETLTVAKLLEMQGSTPRETRVSMQLYRSDASECGTLSFSVRIIPSLTVPIGTDISKYMRSTSLHRRSPTSSSSLSISPTPTLESDEGYHSSLSLTSSMPTTPGENVPAMKTILFSMGHEKTKSLRMDAPILPIIVTTAPSP